MVCFIIFFYPDSALAYIGPGAGFALLSSLLTLIISFLLAFFSFLTLPLRLLFVWLKRRKTFSKSAVDRVIVIGFDGLDPNLCEQYLKDGKLPNFARLRDKGSFKRLETTCPAISPVAWSSFSTGVNPGKHNIYDFLTRNPGNYLPELSSSRIGNAKRVLKFGKFQFPIGKPVMQFLRKSKSFWRILGEYGIFSHIIRVPITFPPEKFYGALLSAMCTPDLQGTQGTFSFYSTHLDTDSQYTGGIRLPFQRNGNVLTGELIGPENSIKTSSESLKLPFSLTLLPDDKKIKLSIAGKISWLNEREFSPWIKVTFKAGLGIKVRGICQFYLKRLDPEVELYVSPIHMDPEKPALPISHPYYFSVYLAKLLGSFGSLGLIEDTWALYEYVLDDEAFLQPADRIHEEREKQLFHAVKSTRKGFCACVFDGTDRIQHMFFRYLVKDHPANRGKDTEKFKDTIQKEYQKADSLLGRIMEQISDDTVLFVMSDHGFRSFVRGINLNSWLHQNGYLVLKKKDFSADYFQNVDWSKTQAYALGLAGIYLNIKGREALGFVESNGEATRLKKKIISGLTGLKDPGTGKIAINRVFDAKTIYSGPYVRSAPDLIIGYNDGYRISWDATLGKTTKEVFEDNIKCWSGDHGVDPKLVPGVLFSNHKIKSANQQITDLAPTVLKLFGIPIPGYMDGNPLDVELKK